jgi:hypothetical protein
MKKLTGIGAVLCCALLTASCDDKPAQQYSQQLVDLLDTYQTQVDTKVAAEKASYKESASIYESARKQNIAQSLEDERIQRAEELATSLERSDHLPRTTEIRDKLRDYADFDIASTTDLLLTEDDAQTQYLNNLEALESESQTIDNLRTSMKLLTKSPGRLKQIRDAAVFAQESKQELDKLICLDLKKAVDALKAQVAAAAGNEPQVKILNQQIAELESQRKDKKCE